MFIIQRGVRCFGVAIILATIAGISLAEAGTFFAETPKNAPRLGRRSDDATSSFVSKRSERDPCWAWLPALLTSLQKSDSSDQAGNQCLTLQDFMQISVFKMAILRLNSNMNSQHTWDHDDFLAKNIGAESFEKWRHPIIKQLFQQEE